MKYKIVGETDSVLGHLRYGHYELELSEEEYKEFQSLSEKEQMDWVKDGGDFIVDDYEVEDAGSIYNIKIEKITEGL